MILGLLAFCITTTSPPRPRSTETTLYSSFFGLTQISPGNGRFSRSFCLYSTSSPLWIW